jgi:pyruvate kinase
MKTGVIVTFGPACDDLRVLRKIIDILSPVIRINAKYVSMKDYDKIIQKVVRAGNAKIMIDIKNRAILKKIQTKNLIT